MENCIVMRAVAVSGLSPQQIFSRAHRKHGEEAVKFHYREWLIWDTITIHVEALCLRLAYPDEKGGSRGT